MENDEGNVPQVTDNKRRILAMMPVEMVLPDKFKYIVESDGKNITMIMGEDISNMDEDLVKNTILFCKTMYGIVPKLENNKIIIRKSGGDEILSGLLFELCARLSCEGDVLPSLLTRIERSLIFE